MTSCTRPRLHTPLVTARTHADLHKEALAPGCASSSSNGATGEGACRTHLVCEKVMEAHDVVQAPSAAHGVCNSPNTRGPAQGSTSAPSLVNNWVEALEFYPCVVGRELPVDGDLLGIAFPAPGIDFAA